MSITRAADMRSHAVSPAEIVFGIRTSRAEEAEREAFRVQRRMSVTKVAVRSWRPSRIPSRRPPLGLRFCGVPGTTAFGDVAEATEEVIQIGRASCREREGSAGVRGG